MLDARGAAMDTARGLVYQYGGENVII